MPTPHTLAVAIQYCMKEVRFAVQHTLYERENNVKVKIVFFLKMVLVLKS